MTDLRQTVLDGSTIRLVGFIAAIGLVACSGSQQDDRGSSLTGQNFAVAEELPTAAGPTLDAIFEEIGQAVPGFAGIYIDADGVPTIQLVDSARRDIARAAVLQRFGEVAAIRERPARIRIVNHSFEQLKDWRDALYKKLPGGVRVVDIDEKQNVIHVGVSLESEVGPIRSEGRRLDIPASALLVDVAPAMRPTTFLGDPVRPTMGGLAIQGTYHACTLGFNARKTGGTRYFVTNSHCTGTYGAVHGSVFGQYFLSGFRVGVEVSDPSFVTGGGCPASGGCRFADAALIQYDTATVGANYTVAQTLFPYTGTDPTQSGSSELTAEPFFVVGELSDASLISGLALSKVGATSGWTSGTIISTCADWALPGSKMLRCQYTVSGVAVQGDSGSPVFSYELSTGKAWIAGVEWGATLDSFTFSPLSGVKADLGAMTVSKPVF